jgi:hypothetical protein
MTSTVEQPPIDALDAGVIEEARTRQRRHRVAGAGALAALILIGVLAFGFAGGGSAQPRSGSGQATPSLTWLTGPALGASRLLLVASENTGPASIVNVDSGRVHAINGLGVPRRQTLWSPTLFPIVAAPGGALAVVTRQACQSCTVSKTNYLIGANGFARKVATLTLARDQYTTAQALHSARTWVLTWPRSGRCTLRLEPSSRPDVPAPCGSLVSDTPAGLLVNAGKTVLVINPQSGKIRVRVRVSGPLDVLPDDLALTSNAPGFPADSSSPTDLTVINLATGYRRHLRWPSILHFSYRVIPEPRGSLVAVEFVEPAYTPGRETIGQATDVWMLDPRTATFTHVPAFPILERLKFSSMAWTADDRLVIVAQGGALSQPGNRTVVGVWRPGQRTIRVRALPTLDGYSQIVPLDG